MFWDADGGSGIVRVKICGITNRVDAEAAIAFGADALGLNYCQSSRRYLALAAAADWLRELPLVSRIAVLVDPTMEATSRVAALPFIDALQLHGNETTEFCAALKARGIKFAKALRASDLRSLNSGASFATANILLDSASPESFGGTGTTFPWEIAKNFQEKHPHIRLTLAGGLTPENVSAAVHQVRPFAVDVTTGVESSAGWKDHGLLRAFISAAKSAV